MVLYLIEIVYHVLGALSNKYKTFTDWTFFSSRSNLVIFVCIWFLSTALFKIVRYHVWHYVLDLKLVILIYIIVY